MTGFFVAAALLAGLAGAPPGDLAAPSPQRDWLAHPAVVEMERQPSVIYAVSDIHGHYQTLVDLLVRHHLAEIPAGPTRARWTGGSSVLLVVGDLIDKGPQSLPVIELMRALQASAERAGGRVIVTLGNHEGEFLADPGNRKTSGWQGFAQELRRAGIDPQEVGRGQTALGSWLRDLPLAARLGPWFFAHAGDTHGRSVAELETALELAVDRNDFRDDEIVGADSILESRHWYRRGPHTAEEYAVALGVSHIVFGHTPKALGRSGRIGMGADGRLFRIDCGLAKKRVKAAHLRRGALLRIRLHAGTEMVESLDRVGTSRLLWMGQVRSAARQRAAIVR